MSTGWEKLGQVIVGEVQGRMPGSRGRRVSDRAKWYTNAGIAVVILIFGGRWVASYLDREQVMRDKQHAAFMEKLDRLSSNIQTLALEIREDRSRSCR